MIIFCSIYCVNVFRFNIQLSKRVTDGSFLFLCKTLVFLSAFLEFGRQNRYNNLKSALDQPLRLVRGKIQDFMLTLVLSRTKNLGMELAITMWLP